MAGFAGWIRTDGYAGSVHSLAPVRSARTPAWRMCAASSSTPIPPGAQRIAAEALERIVALYAIDKEARGQASERRVALRRARAAPRFDDLERWQQAQLSKISGKTPLAAAIHDAVTRLKRLRPYIEHGFLEIGNNPAERAMRPIALGRKNLFMGSANGGGAAAIA